MKIIQILSFLFAFNTLFAQDHNFCVNDQLYQTNRNEISIEKKQPDNTFAKDEVLHVRTVVHVLYYSPEQNFSDEKIEELIGDVNDIFRGNGNSSLVHPDHRDLIHDSNIRFCLASIDPDGNPTNGITHKFTGTIQHFNFNFIGVGDENEDVKTDSLGGTSPWDVEQYLNIWIAPMGSDESWINYGVPFNSYFPLGAFTESGIPGAVIDSKSIIDPVFFFSAAGLTAHECGHALGLMHTWGEISDDGSFCINDDYMEDTPNCGSTFVCFDINDEETCTDSINNQVDNFANIMNYACKQMLSPNQSETIRNNLAFTPGLIMEEVECNQLSFVKEFDSNSNIEIFPNPTNDSFFIKTLEGRSLDAKVSLFTIAGQLVETQDLSLNSSQPFLWDVEDCNDGLYFLSIETKNKSLIKKILIQK